MLKLCQLKGIGDAGSCAGSVKSDGGSSVDSPMGTAAEMPVPRDVLLSMSEYMSGVDHIVASTHLWEKANGQIVTGGKSKNGCFVLVVEVYLNSNYSMNILLHLLLGYYCFCS